nr:MAG TPA: protein of unknown function (DUF4969) [Caudoviricetes sp.]
MKKLALAVMLGIGVMVSGCGNNQDMQVNNVQATQQENTIKWLDNTNADKPNLKIGDRVRFDTDKCQPNQQSGIIMNGRKLLTMTYGGEHGMTTYVCDITDVKDGEEAVLVVDSNVTTVQDAQNLKLAGLYTGKGNKCVVTNVVGHAEVIK